MYCPNFHDFTFRQYFVHNFLFFIGFLFFFISLIVGFMLINLPTIFSSFLSVMIHFLNGCWYRMKSIHFEHLVTGAAGSVRYK